jgi:hypothetical protein
LVFLPTEILFSDRRDKGARAINPCLGCRNQGACINTRYFRDRFANDLIDPAIGQTR